MRSAKRTDDRWPSRTYRAGYVQNRNGIAVLRYAQRSKSTGLRFVPFVAPSPELEGTERTCLSMLDAWIKSIHDELTRGPVAADAPSSVQEIAIRYIAAHPGMTRDARIHVSCAIDTYFPEPMPLDAKRIVRRMTTVHAHPTTTREVNRRNPGGGVDRVSVTRPLARATIRKRFQMIRMVLRWAWRNEWFDEDPTERVEPPKTGTAGRGGARAFEESEILRILAFFDRQGAVGRQWSLLWQFLHYTGARSNEAITLMWDDVDADHIRIFGKRERVDEPKLRGFPLASFEEVRVVIDELRAIRDAGPAGTLHPPAGRVFPWAKNASQVCERLRRCLHGLGIPGSVKTFRVTAGVRWTRLGFSERLIADLRGHTEKVATKYYRPEQMASDIAERIARERGQAP